MKQAARMQQQMEQIQNDLAKRVTGTGSLVPMAQANVNFKVGGVLTEIDATVGSHVIAGEVLARVDATAANQALTQAKEISNAEMGKVTAGFNLPGLG